MESCRFCGARLFEGAGHCARCLAPIALTQEEVAGALLEVDAAAGRWQEPPHQAAAWRAEERFTDSPAPPVYSRWHASTQSFGPRVKITVTVFIVLLPVILWTILPLLALEFVLVWSTIVAPLILRDLWKRRRIR